MPLDVEQVRARVPGREIVWLDSTPSTMTVAAGLAPGTVVVAEEQTAGQGRHGRHWHSEKGMGLYVSMVLRPDLPVEALPAMTLAIGLAAREAIRLAAGVACDLKWPNDLLACGRKCAGIIVQRGASGVVAGIGVNVNQTAFPADLQGSAISLRMATGAEQSREELLARILESMDTRLGHAFGLAGTKGDEHAAGIGRRQFEHYDRRL